MYLIAFPLLLLPFAFFNIVIFLLNMPFTDTIFTIPLVSEPAVPPVFDRKMSVTTADLIVAMGMLLLYVDHLLSLIVFIAMAADLALVPRAIAPNGAASTLLLLTVLGFVDVIAGLSIRPVQQKIVLERSERAAG